MAGEQRTLTVRLESGSDRPVGAIVADGEELGFTGWIELASLIERLRAAAPTEPPSENLRAPRRSP